LCAALYVTDSLKLLINFFFSFYGAHRDLHSFPTRRSSDLALILSLRIAPIEIIVKSLPSRINRALPSTAISPSFRSTPPCPLSRSEEHTSELQSRENLVCRLLLEKKKQ